MVLLCVCGQACRILTAATTPPALRRGLYNITYVCESVLSDECIAQYGPAGCWFAAMTASGHGTGPNASGSSTNDTNDTNDINDAKGGVPSEIPPA